MDLFSSNWFAYFVAATISLFLYAAYTIRKTLIYFEERNIPYLKPKYLLMSEPDGTLMRENVHISWDKIYKRLEGHKIGGFFQIVPMLMVRDPEYVHTVLVSAFEHFTDRTFHIDEKTNPLDAHLFFLRGKEWKVLRSKLSPIFTNVKLKWMFQEMDNCGNEFFQSIDKLADGKDVDLLEILAAYATDVIGSCAFGLEGQSLKDPNSLFRQIGKEMFQSNEFNWSMLTFAISQMVPSVFKVLRIRTMSRHREEYFCSLISNVIKHRQKTGIQRKDVIQLLIEMKVKGQVQIRSADLEQNEENDIKYYESTGEKIEITDKLLAAQSLLFLLAGFETSSRTMHYLLYLLAEHQDIQERARMEVLEVKAKYGQFHFDALKELKFLEKCISETLRLFPMPPQVRECTKNFTFPDGTFVEKGTQLVVPVFSIQRDPNYFTDALKFDPDRFDLPPVRGTYLPFGDGPRNCIGMKFAFLEVKIILARLLERYSFEHSSLNKTSIEDIPMSRWTLFLAPKDGLYMRVSKLNANK